jgi:YHS domain-containing protein
MLDGWYPRQESNRRPTAEKAAPAKARFGKSRPLTREKCRESYVGIDTKVGGMELDSSLASAQMVYEGQPYYFCSEECMRQFRADPKRYIRAQADQNA